MSTLRAYLGVAGLTDVGYRLYNRNTALAARSTTDILDEGEGWYSAGSVTLAGADNVRWDSTATPNAVAREDITVQAIVETNLNALVSSRSSHSAADIWAVGTRSLTTFGTLAADVATAVWAAATRTLSAFGFTVNTNANATETAIKAKTDNLPATPAAMGDSMTLTAGERTSIATAVWASATRTLSSFGTLVADVATAVWAAATRTLSAFGFTVNTNANATETAIKAKTDNLPATPAAMGDAMTLTAGERTSIATAVWTSATRTLSGFGSLISDLWANATRTLTALPNPAPTGYGGGGGSASDPLENTPATYDAGTIGALIGKLDVGAPEDPIIPIVAIAAAGQAIGYVVTRDGSGLPISGVPIFFQLTAVLGLDSYRTASFQVVSADDDAANPGVLQHAFQRGASYRAKRAAFDPPLSDSAIFDKWVTFTVPDSADPFPLPQILGSG